MASSDTQEALKSAERVVTNCKLKMNSALGVV